MLLQAKWIKSSQKFNNIFLVPNIIFLFLPHARTGFVHFNGIFIYLTRFHNWVSGTTAFKTVSIFRIKSIEKCHDEVAFLYETQLTKSINARSGKYLHKLWKYNCEN